MTFEYFCLFLTFYISPLDSFSIRSRMFYKAILPLCLFSYLLLLSLMPLCFFLTHFDVLISTSCFPIVVPNSWAAGWVILHMYSIRPVKYFKKFELFFNMIKSGDFTWNLDFCLLLIHAGSGNTKSSSLLVAGPDWIVLGLNHKGSYKLSKNHCHQWSVLGAIELVIVRKQSVFL